MPKPAPEPGFQPIEHTPFVPADFQPIEYTPYSPQVTPVAEVTEPATGKKEH